MSVLRMELDIQSFMQNHDQQKFEFQHFPTSYLRLAAHRVAEHYRLQSMVADSSVDGLRTRIVRGKRSMTNHGLASSIAQAIPSQGWQSQPVQAYCLSRDVNEGSKISINEIDKTPITRDGNTTRVAILRDREKDRSDPDYDRNYGR
ncbi:hypothetical protein IFM89_016906 [Coptis chinensis]|uniref:R3H domain-containing protein n=1 Tax=Coptis chinensis TaxID=261450 RepID=A0A835HZ07_9MAGN|nr:hypothetical protein IFM89_016906 [Coptis chinensis]